MDVWQKIKDATDIVRREIASKVEPFPGVLRNGYPYRYKGGVS